MGALSEIYIDQNLESLLRPLALSAQKIDLDKLNYRKLLNALMHKQLSSVTSRVQDVFAYLLKLVGEEPEKVVVFGRIKDFLSSVNHNIFGDFYQALDQKSVNEFEFMQLIKARTKQLLNPTNEKYQKKFQQVLEDICLNRRDIGLIIDENFEKNMDNFEINVI